MQVQEQHAVRDTRTSKDIRTCGVRCAGGVTGYSGMQQHIQVADTAVDPGTGYRQTPTACSLTGDGRYYG